MKNDTELTKYICGFFLLFAIQPVFLLAQVKVESSESQITVTVNGKQFTALQIGKDANKPYLAPLLTASGKHITRGFPMEKIAGEATDHPHQRGIWMGFEHLSGMNLWELDPADPHPASGEDLRGKAAGVWQDTRDRAGILGAAETLDPLPPG